MEEIIEQQNIPSVSGSVPAKNIFKIVLFVFLAVILGTGLVFAGIKIGKKQISPTSMPNTSVNTESIMPVSNETLNWKTYTGRTVDGLSFSFQYPATLSYGNSPFQYCLSKPATNSGYGPIPNCMSFDIIGKKDSQDTINGLSPGSKTVSIAGHKSYQIIEDKPPSGMAGRIYITTFLDNSDVPIIGLIAYIGVPSDTKNSLDRLTTLFDQILSTFKFLN